MKKSVESLRDYVRTYFGPKWPLALALLAAAIFWPVIVFRSSLTFDKSTFTEEWLKMGIGSLLLFLFIDYISRGRESRVLTQGITTFVVQYYLAPLSSLRMALYEVNAAVISASGDGNFDLPNIASFWKNFESNISLVMSAPGVESAASIMAVINQVNLTRMRNIVNSLQAMKSPADLNKGEYEEIVRSVDKLLSGLTNLRQAWEKG